MKRKAISLWQPWAQLLVLGIKRYETRSWSTEYRGELVVHAARRPTPEVEDLNPRTGFPAVELEAIYRRLEREGFARGELALGAALGTVILDDVIPTEQLEPLHERVGPEELLLGNFAPGRFAWRVSCPLVWIPPRPCRGAQRLFELEVPA